MSYVEQRRSGMRMSVFDAVLLGRKPYIQWDMTAKDLDVAESAIDQLELTAYVHRYLDEISGGELQKVMIARAIAQEPQIMLMDEPTNHLDLKNQLDVLDTIRRIVKAKKLTAIVALHDLNLALRYADRFIFMKDRGIYAAGGREVVTPETIEAVYAVPVYLQQCAHYTLVVPK
jgi:iron complex transport system ATP-binding protein